MVFSLFNGFCLQVMIGLWIFIVFGLLFFGLFVLILGEEERTEKTVHSFLGAFFFEVR